MAIMFLLSEWARAQKVNLQYLIVDTNPILKHNISTKGTNDDIVIAYIRVNKIII